MNLLLLAALAALPASAKTRHAVTVEVVGLNDRFVHTFALTDGEKAVFAGPVQGLVRGTVGRMNADVWLFRTPAGDYQIQHAIQLRPEAGEGPSLTTRGELGISAGAPLTIVDCGPWLVRLAVDAVKGRGIAAPIYEPNVEAMAEFRRERFRSRCRQVLRNGTQADVTENSARGGRSFGFAMSALPAVSPTGRAALQYQIKFAWPTASEEGLEASGDSQLQLGRRRVVSSLPDRALSVALDLAR